jgi:hypothetical protein
VALFALIALDALKEKGTDVSGLIDITSFSRATLKE